MELDKVKSFLRVDFDDDDNLLKIIMEASEQYIVGAVGEYDGTNPKANLLFMALVQDMYDNRELMVSEQRKKSMVYTYASIILQLQYDPGGRVDGD
ncbi:head-tail connector protein [Lacrimispora celerecrescens]|uniref:head-tail connector protein n=1 Tax=Lacrimispora celerecrescens TaxID=29354 RepID=UPI001649B36C|nr:head-tail connector protein [Lacrimispora celerecrescens]